LQQQYHTRLATADRRAVTRMNERRPVTRAFLSLAVVVLFASAVWAQPAAAEILHCRQDDGGDIAGDGSDQVVRAYSFNPDPDMGAALVTLAARSLGAGQTLITVSLIRSADTSGQPVVSTNSDYAQVEMTASFTSATTVTVTVNGAIDEPVQWFVRSVCIPPTVAVFR
jgi:hypothetical protein